MRDSVDDVLDGWARERPDLDVAPVGVVTRLARVRAHLDAGVQAVFDRHDLSPADFQVIVSLRRAGAPFELPQARLVDRLGLTSGTVSVRVDRLVRRGVVVRGPDPQDARVTLVRLTAEGQRLFDVVAPEHLANEDRLLSALDDDERAVLAGLLRRLLVSFEHGVVGAALPLGLRLEPAHRARARRRAAGLSDPPGLLVVEVVPRTPAADAGVLVGDLLVEACGRPVRDEATLAAALTAPRGRRRAARLVVLRAEERVTVEVAQAPRDSATRRIQ